MSLVLLRREHLELRLAVDALVEAAATGGDDVQLAGPYGSFVADPGATNPMLLPSP